MFRVVSHATWTALTCWKAGSGFLFTKFMVKLDVLARANNSSIWPADAEGLRVWEQPELHGHLLFTKEIMSQIFFLEISII